VNFFGFGRHVFGSVEDDGMRQIEALYRAHGPDLLAYLRRRFGGAETAEDLLQETFARALGALDGISRAASPRAWLFGIARHVGLAALRRRRAASDLPADAAAAGPAAADERLETVRQAMAGLPKDQRETLDLRLVHGLTYEEIADVLGIPVGTVRSRLHHAVRRLRDAVAPVAEEKT
jgi:RNA polymerase sigma-70 factor (ECF subfamily)